MQSEDASILLISCYELGHQPMGIAMPAAFLQRDGYRVASMDVSVDSFDQAAASSARFIGISVPMHTALRLGVRVAEAIRAINPQVHICFYGLYASLNCEYLMGTVADSIIGGEFEEPLVRLARAVVDDAKPISVEGVTTKERQSPAVLERLAFPVPSRVSLPGLERYAKLEYRGEERLAGYVEASRGCLHHCTHCPIPPVYEGRFFVVPREVVLEDIRGLVAAGARHITFGDPDFLNGPTHALRLVGAMHAEFPQLTFDFTAKIEHLLKHRSLLEQFSQAGCIFIVSAVESFSDEVLGHLEKGHTRGDVFEALEALRRAGIALRPTFVPFTPWATIDDFVDLLDRVAELDLIDHVDPVQYSIRLLVPPGSLLLARPDSRRWLKELNHELFSYEWAHPDPRVDDLQRDVSELVEKAASSNEDAAETFYRIRELAQRARGDEVSRVTTPPIEPARLRPPRLTESWFCCAEPTRAQLNPLEVGGQLNALAVKGGDTRNELKPSELVVLSREGKTAIMTSEQQSNVKE